MSHIIPSRDDLTCRLERLCSGEESREQVSAWAMSIIDDDTIRIKDPIVWDVLESLGAVDLPSTDKPYLYDLIDFESWLLKLSQ
ncbi:hypothetical protein [Stenoxybacter acetivorans]|uniref:hypothetical protein n=1 Tax=Stenoxybacter acetivorans TaxID=422441 RepID=UPI0006923E95|nr:hypothetical protein [Stenoxybacter acetivorans]